MQNDYLKSKEEKRLDEIVELLTNLEIRLQRLENVWNKIERCFVFND